jgi:hypothetical protein
LIIDGHVTSAKAYDRQSWLWPGQHTG